MPEAKVLWSNDEPLNEADTTWYRSQIGSLNYFAMTTRYDIAHAVSRLSQCAAKPTRGSHTALVRVLKYLVNNPTHNLTGKRPYKDKLSVYSDSDHATAGCGVLCLLFPLAVRAHIKPDGRSHGCLTSWASGSRLFELSKSG